MNDRHDINLNPEADHLEQLTPNKSQTKKPYLSPKLKKFGRFRDLTLGGSFGMGDSGNANVEKF